MIEDPPGTSDDIDWSSLIPKDREAEDGGFEQDPQKFFRAVVAHIERDLAIHKKVGSTRKGHSLEMLAGYLLAVREMAQLVEGIEAVEGLDALQERLRVARRGEAAKALMGEDPPEEVLWPNPTE